MDKGRRQVVTRDGDERDSKPGDEEAVWSNFLTAEKVHIRSFMIVFMFDRLAACKKTVFLDFLRNCDHLLSSTRSFQGDRNAVCDITLAESRTPMIVFT